MIEIIHWAIGKYITHGFVSTYIGMNILLHVTVTESHPYLIHTFGKYSFSGRDDEWERVCSFGRYGIYRSKNKELMNNEKIKS